MSNLRIVQPECGCAPRCITQMADETGDWKAASITYKDMVLCPEHGWCKEKKTSKSARKYESNNFTVEAIQYLTGENHTCFELEEFLGWDEGSGRVCDHDGKNCNFSDDDFWFITTIDAYIFLLVGNWLIKVNENRYFTLTNDEFTNLFTKKNKLEDEIDEIEDAWLNEGPEPDYHRKAKRKLKKLWPRLHKVLETAYG